MTPEEAARALYDWSFWARPNQLAPAGNWRKLLWLAGRGFGKTRCIVEWARHQAETRPGTRGALVARTAADVRDVLIEGESGLLACCPPDNMPHYEPSKRRLTWKNGSIATTYSADEPKLLRGPQHHWAVVDEVAQWSYPDAFDQLMFGLRLGDDPRVAIATTPKPKRIIRELVVDPHAVVIKGRTRDNAKNLAPQFLTELMTKYEGTSLGRQELDAELLDEAPGALWKRAMFDRPGFRVQAAPPMRRIVVAIDPSVTAKEGSDEAGIVAAGVGEDGLFYVLTDVSGILSPDAWARRAIDLYKDLRADRIVAEVNQGGDLVSHVLRTIDGTVAIQPVHASRGKRARAEPVAALYEQQRVRHVGVLADLEDQLCTYVPGVDTESPDRLDALVWAMSSLMTSQPVTVDLDLDAGYRDPEWQV